MKFLIKGTHVPHRKNTAAMPAIKISPPPYVVLPMSMHIGKPAIPEVKPGDHVDVGQRVGSQNGFISSPVYASVSGTVKKCDDVLLSNGSYCPAVMIESDGLMTPYAEIKAPEVTDKASFIAAVRDSGLVGLGGAGFPTYVKLSINDPSSVDELIINGAECEPYITSDTRTMIDRADEIEDGIKLIMKYLGIKKVVIAVEKNKPQAIERMKDIESRLEGVSVKVLPSSYPQGGEKVIIYNVTGKMVPPGKLPLDVGSVVCNCTTVAAISRYIRTGMPLVEKCLTVDGGAVKSPKNVIAPIGTPIEYVLEAAGGFSEAPAKILYGGPMMGIAVPDISAPVLKNTNALLAFNSKEARLPEETACIRCGNCVNSCPFGLRPTDISFAYKANDGAALKELDTMTCMECGCCSYVCPAKKPLVQTNKLAKQMLREYLEKEKKALEEEKAHAESNKG